jgi:hypothetical protein
LDKIPAGNQPLPEKSFVSALAALNRWGNGTS